ncbi:hypothetical protein ILYODFUR_020655 [Ilyodon furcidens]|uniref:Uncharacterized protein n=1 Tax=Ilyodon furcidens TaxID=33524 RepID=A0ABV0TK96_9TELE
MLKIQRKLSKTQTPKENAKKDTISATMDHDYVSDMETKRGAGGKSALDDMADLLHTPSKGAHVCKITNHNTTMEDLLEAIQALQLRFDTQYEKMADMTAKLTQNTVMISSLAKAPKYNAAEVKDCKEKIATMETEVSITRKEVNKLQVNLRQLDHYKQR